MVVRANSKLAYRAAFKQGGNVAAAAGLTGSLHFPPPDPPTHPSLSSHKCWTFAISEASTTRFLPVVVAQTSDSGSAGGKQHIQTPLQAFLAQQGAAERAPCFQVLLAPLMRISQHLRCTGVPALQPASSSWFHQCVVGSAVSQPSAQQVRRHSTSAATNPHIVEPLSQEETTSARSHSQTSTGLQQQPASPSAPASFSPDVGALQHMQIHAAGVSRKGHAPGYKVDNQDAVLLVSNFVRTGTALFAVFDGHGHQGRAVSQYLKHALPTTVLDALLSSKQGAPPTAALTAAFKRLDISMDAAAAAAGPMGLDVGSSGSTAVVCFLQPDGVLSTAWVGDSRAVLATLRQPTPSVSGTGGSVHGDEKGNGRSEAQHEDDEDQIVWPNTTSGAYAAGVKRASSSAASSSRFASSRSSSRSSGSAGARGWAEQAVEEEDSSSHSRNGSGISCRLSTSGNFIIHDSGQQRQQAEHQLLPPHWDVQALSSDHKPDRPDERRRIVMAGGRVSPSSGPAGHMSGPARVWFRGLDYPGLAMSRAFGDTLSRAAGITAVPETHSTQIRALEAAESVVGGGHGTAGAAATGSALKVSPHHVLLLATDGVWDVFENDEAVEMVTHSITGTGHGHASASGRPGIRSNMHSSAYSLQEDDAEQATILSPVPLQRAIQGANTCSSKDHAAWLDEGAVSSSGRRGGEEVAATACRALVDEAQRRWKAQYGGAYIDDISAVVVLFSGSS